MFIEQERATQTRQAFLDAMTSLLEEKAFEEISVADIAARAERAVGSFYTKFKDKDELLDLLLDRYEDERAKMDNSSLALAKWIGTDLRARVDGVAKITVKEFRKRRGLFIALETCARRSHRPKNDPKMTPLYDRVAQLLMQCKKEIAHKDAERAARFAFFLLTSLCSRGILYSSDSHPATLRMTDAEITRRGADAMYAYLKSGEK
jgi:AcrR family transcriptional regulator